jgi:hypothetical protein
MSKLLRNVFFGAYLWILAVSPALQGIGTVSNQLVLWANGDKFPVMLSPVKIAALTPDANGMIDPIHCVMTSATHLNWLADIWDFHSQIDSIGDLTLDFSDWLASPLFFIWLTLIACKATRREQLQHA